VAGDFYDVFASEPGEILCLVIADVCDKGVGAALFMALSRSLLRAFAEFQKGARADPKNLIERINAYILRHHPWANMFVTLFFGVLEPATGLLTYVNGGHNPPVIIGATGIKARLEPTGPAVGMFPDVTFQARQVSLALGEVMFAFTDGVTEARDVNGGFFTEARLLQLLEQPATSAMELIQRIEESVRAHTAAADQSDDITMLVVRRHLASEA
jgi:phosphoserine phosphatase RsbU/P